MGARFALLIVIASLVYGLLLFNLYNLQLTKGEEFVKRANAQYEAAGLLEAPRGVVYFTDKEGGRVAAALNRALPHLYAVPKEIKDPDAAAALLAPILGESREALAEKFGREGALYALLRDKADAETVSAVRALGLHGIYVRQVPKRVYPFGTLAAHLLGFVGSLEESTRLVGRYGVEEYYEYLLGGTPGLFEGGRFREPEPGEDLVLTVDPAIQREAERILDGLVGKHRAEGGGILVQDPTTGKLLAMAARPGFDPNAYRGTPLGHFLNPLMQGVYEPGSVVKVLTMAAGINAGAVTPMTAYTDAGSVTVNGKTIRNFDLATHGPYGRITMYEVLEHSVNTGAVFVERLLGRERFKEYMERFGLGAPTGVDLGGEVAGDLRRLSPRERDIAFATASYGQGISVTPLELIGAVSAIANEGALMRPYLRSALAPETLGHPVRRDTARVVAEMMVRAVDRAKVAAIKGYAVAGKTGTANVPDFEQGGYTEEVVNTYVGFAPASDPRFTILIKLDKPAGAPVASLTVVPAFRDLAQFILNYYDIPPDRL